MTARILGPLLQRSRQEDGMAMIVAIIVLLVVSLITTVIISTADQTNLSTRHDANYKNAAEAAEAGLQVAAYRLNMLVPSTTQCVGDAVASAGTNGLCQSSTVSMGNGSSYSYTMSPVLSLGSTCIGLTITNSDVNNRCITAVGVSNGVQARSQIRTAAFAAQPLFPVSGVIGLQSVTLSGSAKVAGVSGTNGAFKSSGSAGSLSGLDLGPAGSDSDSSSVHSTPVTHLTSPLVLSPVNPGTSNQTSLSACPARAAAGYTSCNDDYRITNGLASPKVSPYDQSSSSGVTYTASTRTLVVSGNSASLTLGGGLYNFCNVTVQGGGSLTIAPSVQTEIFIDSPDDPGSGCASNSGNLTLSGGSTWFNPSNNPLAAQFYVYGRNNDSGTITISGSSAMYGVLYAPQSQVTLSGSGSLNGSIAAYSVTISGGGLAWDNRVGTLQATTVGTFYRTGWAQCSPTPTVSTNPGSGCG